MMNRNKAQAQQISSRNKSIMQMKNNRGTSLPAISSISNSGGIQGQEYIY